MEVSAALMFAVIIAILMTSSINGTHLNPAIWLSLASIHTPRKKYLAQLIGEKNGFICQFTSVFWYYSKL